MLEPSIIGIIILGSLLLTMALGLPIAFGMGGISLILGFIFWGGATSFDAFSLGAFGKMCEFSLTAIPLFITMAAILQYSDMADDMYEAVYRWLGQFKAGLLSGTTVISAIFAAMVGITSVATATLGLTARPSMLKRGYDDRLILGTIMAGGSLGILIPPSVVMIIYATEADVSAGQLFMGGIGPGIVGAFMMILFNYFMCVKNPNLGPAVPKEERFSMKEKIQSLKSIILPVLVILLVLGTIYTGVGTPTEAASIGVVGALICAAAKKKLGKADIKKMGVMAVRINTMVFWIILGAVAYSRIVAVTGVGDWFGELVTGLPVSPYVTLLLMLLVFFFMGMFIDPAGIILMTGPLFLPVIIALGFDTVWFGVLFVINMCMGYMTPPFGYNLFVMKGVAPDVSIGKIYTSIWPYVVIYAVLMILVVGIPDIALWLPHTMIGG